MGNAESRFRWRAHVGAARHKLRLLRYGVVSRLARALARRRPQSSRILLWPEFDLPGDAEPLRHALLHARHYLRGTALGVEYFVRVDGRLHACEGPLEGSPLPLGPEVPGGLVPPLRSARFVARWRQPPRPKATSLQPHEYVIADAKDHCEAREWLRLVADARAAERAGPPAPARLPPFPVRSCAVLGSGPSLALFAAERDRYDACIAMNSAVLDPAVLGGGNVFAACALDPDYFSPHDSVKPFWDAVFALVRTTPAIFVTSLPFAPFIELHFPEDVRLKCHYVRTIGEVTLAWRTRFDLRRPVVASYGNVLTDLALPLAASISKEVTIYGCDGRAPGRAGASFEKHPGIERYDRQFEQERPGKYGPALLDRQLVRFYEATRVVADECRGNGVSLRVRVPSHNLGLVHLPTVDAGDRT